MGELRIEEARIRLATIKQEAGFVVNDPVIDRAVLMLANGSKALQLLASEGKVEGVTLDMSGDDPPEGRG